MGVEKGREEDEMANEILYQTSVCYRTPMAKAVVQPGFSLHFLAIVHSRGPGAVLKFSLVAKISLLALSIRKS